MKTYGFTFARGGSKGVPGKNIKSLCGKPLIAYAIEVARATGRFDRLIVSTDSEEIATVAREYGAETPFLRPADLSGDSSAEWLAWRHAIQFLRDSDDDFDIFVSMPTTAPLRLPEDIIRCLDVYTKGHCDSVIGCCDPTHSPFFNMITIDAEGYARIAMQLDDVPVRRQNAPPVYAMAPIAYVLSPEYIMRENSLWEGRVVAVHVARETAVDIDEPLDFEFAEFLMQKRIHQMSSCGYIL